MNRQPYCRPPRWWSPKPSEFWVRFWRWGRRRTQIHKHRLVEIEVRGLENVRQALEQGYGVLITPNHSSHADCFAIYDVADRLGIPFYVMIAWQNFVRDGALRAWILRQHGGFSVDREGNDLTAFRQAVDVLQSKPNPLVIFPEGDVYHVNDRILPFREGPAAIALTAAKRGNRPIVIVPCATKYRYLDDPTSELVAVMGRLETSIHWRPRADLSLRERIYHLAEGALSLKEIEFYGNSHAGPVPERIRKLIDFILSWLEDRYGLDSGPVTVPERVKLLRQQVIRRMIESPGSSPERHQCEEDISDLFLTVQLFSYPGDYVTEDPSIERIAETIDKLEEDVLGVETATIRGSRRATVTLGDPIPVSAPPGRRPSANELTRLLETRVQGLLNGRAPSWHREAASSV
ncbi:MAG: lysophospholipid acyltransferase family protein [Thermoguttaceae bacterium]